MTIIFVIKLKFTFTAIKLRDNSVFSVVIFFLNHRGKRKVKSSTGQRAQSSGEEEKRRAESVERRAESVEKKMAQDYSVNIVEDFRKNQIADALLRKRFHNCI